MTHTITLLSPEVCGQEVVFRWQVDPPTPLYRAPRFFLRFPPSLDIARLPQGVWWSVALLALHGHWPLLRPCRVVLPVQLSPLETECWLRLLDANVATLEALRGTNQVERSIEIISQGPPWWQGLPFPDLGRCATAYSSGKDSLLQAGILGELTDRPVLVTTTSPLPGMYDHLTPRRRQVLQAIASRPDMTWVQVESDYRSCWDNNFARQQGYPISVNEMCDTLLYTGSLLAAGLALGATHLFLASEYEVQENVEQEGRVVQFPHYMYSVVTQRALQALLGPAGVSYSSLTSALHSFQVQELLWTRYPTLRRLQYSCWRVGPNEATCSRCSQCLRIAAGALAIGDRPGRMGIDLVKLLQAQEDFQPQQPAADGRPLTPQQATGVGIHAQLVRSVLATPLVRVLLAIARDQPRALLSAKGWLALKAFRRLRRRLAGRPPGPRPGFCPGFLQHVDPLVRGRLTTLYSEHFPAADLAEYAGVLARSDRLARQIIAPLSQHARAA